MKKTWICLLAALLIPALAACGGAPAAEAPTAAPEITTPEPKAEETDAPEITIPEIAPEEPAAEATAEAEGEDDPDYYSGVTAMDRDAVESFCAEMKSLYLDEDWESMADFLRLPVTVGGVTIDDAESFLAHMRGRTVSAGDREEMEKESCRDMFFNGQGICLGAGELWIIDPGYMTDAEPRLEIIGINGTVER